MTLVLNNTALPITTGANLFWQVSFRVFTLFRHVPNLFFSFLSLKCSWRPNSEKTSDPDADSKSAALDPDPKLRIRVDPDPKLRIRVDPDKVN
jgi:hypothetical protein